LGFSQYNQVCFFLQNKAMLTQHTQDKDEFGFWHNLRQGEGFMKSITTAKKNGDWLMFNLYRRDAALAGELLFGKNKEHVWLVKSEKGDVFRFWQGRDGYIEAEVFSNMDELSDAKMYVSGARFLSSLTETAKQLEQSHPSVFQKINAYPADIYRRPGSVSEDAVTFDSDDSSGADVDASDIPTLKKRRRV
jgi:hypothetical protein